MPTTSVVVKPAVALVDRSAEQVGGASGASLARAATMNGIDGLSLSAAEALEPVASPLPPVDAMTQAELMVRFRKTEGEAYRFLLTEKLLAQRRRSAIDGGEDPEEENELMVALSGGEGACKRKVVDIFRELDRDKDGLVTKVRSP